MEAADGEAAAREARLSREMVKSWDFETLRGITNTIYLIKYMKVCMHVCVLVYVCLYVCLHTRVRMYVCRTYVRVCICMYACMHVCIYVRG